MATRYEILRQIREGKTADQIMSQFHGHLPELKRVMSTRSFRKQLEAERELAAMLAAHRTAVGATEFTDRLAELANGPNGETARKACLALLSEGMKLTRKTQPVTGNSARSILTLPADKNEQIKPESTTVTKDKASHIKRTGNKKTEKITEERRKTLKSIEY